MGLQFGVVAGLIFMATLSTVLLRRALLPTQAGPAIAQVASASPSPVTYTIKLPPKEVDDGLATQLTRDQFNTRLANGHQLELFDVGKRCKTVHRRRR
jgi:hypothetical protein